ncbi:hypothetical protein [Burkholderia ubonensis]|uniref:hypothetical protein n=1 Tax=Burkholderia ubonensis TaxID=101571 RepID=UPI001E36C417|nr:hypothetical protein [Burkholderia ubonensis]
MPILTRIGSITLGLAHNLAAVAHRTCWRAGHIDSLLDRLRRPSLNRKGANAELGVCDAAGTGGADRNAGCANHAPCAGCLSFDAEVEMSEHAVVDENGYRCFCEAYEEPPGVWRALVRFERKRDHAAMQAHIPGMTHKIDETFATHHEAMGAAKAYARYKASQDETGL